MGERLCSPALERRVMGTDCCSNAWQGATMWDCAPCGPPSAESSKARVRRGYSSDRRCSCAPSYGCAAEDWHGENGRAHSAKR